MLKRKMIVLIFIFITMSLLYGCGNVANMSGQVEKNDKDENKKNDIEALDSNGVDVIPDETKLEYSLISRSINGKIVSSALITIFDSGSEILVIPDTIDGYHIAGFGSDFRCSSNSKPALKSIHIGKFFGEGIELSGSELPWVNVIGSIDGLEEIVVSDENPYFTSKDGVLYSKDMKILYICPRCVKSKSFIIPDSVREIKDGAFDGNNTIESLKVSFSDSSVSLVEAFNHMVALRDLCVHNVKNIISSFNSCDKLTNVDIGTGTIEIFDSFQNLSCLENIIFPGTLRNIKERSFSNCEKLEAVVIPESVSYISGTAFKNVGSDKKCIVVPGYMDNNVIDSNKYAYYPYVVADGKKYEINCVSSIFVDQVKAEVGEKAPITVNGCFYQKVFYDADEEKVYYDDQIVERVISQESIASGLFYFESDNDEIAEVSEDGCLVGKAAGSAVITVRTKTDTECFCDFEVEVSD